MIIVAFVVNLHVLRNHSEDLVNRRSEDYYIVLKTSIIRDARLGLMYVPLSETVAPNLHLEHIYREIITGAGDTLTLMSPAAKLSNKLLDIASEYRISAIRQVSHNPLNPNSVADEWEAIALNGLKDEDDRFFEKTEKNGATTYRYMAPLMMEQSCMACHSPQNVRNGELLGGISIDTEFNGTFFRQLDTLSEKLLIIYSLILFIGVFMLLFFGAKFKRREIELELKNQELLDLNVAKDKFIRVMAHDLKSSAANLKSLSETLFNNSTELSEADRNTCMEMMVESAKTHSELLDSLLDLSGSRLGNKEYDPERLDLCKLINTVLGQTKLQAAQKQIRQTNQAGECFVKADRNMITAVIRNLVVNAIKFTRTGGQVVVAVKKADTEAIISVSDNGVGISDIKKDRIFRADGSNRSAVGTANEKGTGLGLLLCKEYVEQNGGTIWFESEEGKGSTFFFTLPFKN